MTLQQVVGRTRRTVGFCVIVACSAMAAGCALTVRAPMPDVASNKPPPPAATASQVAAIARVPYSDIAKAFAKAPFAKKTMGLKASIGSWGLHIERAGDVAVAPSGAKICASVPLVADGHIAAFGKKLQRRFRPELKACARPVLHDDKTLRFEDPDVRVDLKGTTMLDLNARMLRDNLVKYLAGEPREALAKWLKGVKIPADGPIDAFIDALRKPVPMAVGQDGRASCLVLAPTRVVVSQPDPDPTFLRLSVSVQCRPTVQVPCASSDPTAKPDFDVQNSVDHVPTRLVVPVQVPLASMQDPISKELAKLGPIPLKNGKVHIGKVELATAPGRLIAYADVDGEITDNFLFLTYTRRVQGRFAVWGAPVVRGDRIVVDKPNLALQSGDVVADLLVALQRKKIVDRIAKRLEVPQSRVLGGARKRLQSLGTGVTVGGRKIPTRVDVKRLAIGRIVPRAGNLDVQVDFEGWVVVGDVKRR